MVCNSSKTSIPTQPFRIRCKSSVWQVSEHFMARCHKPGQSANGNARFGCVFCPAERLMFESRNELKAHLATHSAPIFESDVDVMEVLLEHQTSLASE